LDAEGPPSGVAEGSSSAMMLRWWGRGSLTAECVTIRIYFRCHRLFTLMQPQSLSRVPLTVLLTRTVTTAH